MDTVRFFIFYNFFRSEPLQQKERNSCNAEIRQTKQRKPFTRRKQPCWKKTDERNSRAAGNMPAFFLLSIGADICHYPENQSYCEFGYAQDPIGHVKSSPCRSDNFIHYNTPALKYQLHTFGCVNLIQSSQTSAEKSWEVLNKSQYASCLHIFRLIARKLLEIHQVFLRRFHTILRKICLRNLHIGFNQRFP